MGSQATLSQPLTTTKLTTTSSESFVRKEKNISFYKCTHCPPLDSNQQKIIAPLAEGEDTNLDNDPSQAYTVGGGTKICQGGSAPSAASSSIIGSPVRRQVYYRNSEKNSYHSTTTDSSRRHAKYFHRNSSSSSHETISSEWDSGWSSGQSPKSGSPDSGHVALGKPHSPQFLTPTPISMASTTRDTILETALNVPHLVIGENEEFNLEPTDQLYLPGIKTFTWHAQLADDAIAPAKTAEAAEDEDEGLGTDAAECEWRLKRWELRRRRTAYMILKAAVNLEEIKDFRFDTDVDLIIRSGKVPAVHHLCLYDTDNVDNILGFIDGGPRVKVLQLISSLQEILDDEEDEGGFFGGLEGRKRLSQSVTKLLDSIRDTLRVLDLSQFCTICVDPEIPQLEKLHQLTLGSPILLGDPRGRIRPSRVLPRHVKLGVSFPYLSVLDVCRLESDENCNWDLYFPSPHSFQNHRLLTTVRVLVVNDQCTHFWMDKLQKLCPNFVKLVLHSDGLGNNLDFMLVKVFRYWQHLEALELRIEDLPIQPFSLDSAFTGLREDTCKLLRVFGPAGHDCMVAKEELEKSYFRPSIANLSHLHTLDIILDHHCLGRLAHQESLTIPLTFVSCRYGFAHLGQLNVAIFFDHNCPWGKAIMKKFESLRPFVTLLHKYDSYCKTAHHHQGNTTKFNR